MPLQRESDHHINYFHKQYKWKIFNNIILLIAPNEFIDAKNCNKYAVQILLIIPLMNWIYDKIIEGDSMLIYIHVHKYQIYWNSTAHAHTISNSNTYRNPSNMNTIAITLAHLFYEIWNIFSKIENSTKCVDVPCMLLCVCLSVCVRTVYN